MKCINCGTENNENAKFCVSCGAAIPKEAEVVVVEAVAKEDPVMMENGAVDNGYMIAPKKKGMGIIGKVLIVIGVILVLGVVAVAAGLRWIFTSPTVALTAAIANTGIAITEEVAEVTEAMPSTAFFENFVEEQYVATVDYEDASIGVTVDVEMDVAASQLKMTPSVMGFGADILVSEEYLTFEMAMLSDVYGVEFATLDEYLVEDGYVEEDLADDMLDATPEELLTEQEEALTAFTDILALLIPDMTEMASVEELDDEEVTINGATVDTKAYGIDIDTAKVREILEKLFDETLESEVLVRYINRQLMTGYLSGELYLDGFAISSLEDTSFIESQCEAYLADFDASAGEMEQVEFVINTYNDRIACVTASLGDELLELQLGVGDKVLEHVSFAMIDASGTTMAIEFGMTLEDDVFQSELHINGEICSLYYDILGTEDNFVLDVFGEVVPLSVDFSNPEVMEITYADDLMEATWNMEKAELPEGWFEQKTEFVNVMELTEEEIQSIFMSVLFGGMF